MLWLNKAAFDALPYAERPVVTVCPHRAITDVNSYHLKMCGSLPNCRWANNIIDSDAPPICQASELPWFVTYRLTINDEQPNITT